MPGVDGTKMSKSKNNAIFLKEDNKSITKKINKAFSGGQKTIEEHKKLGGNPDVDIACQYLSKLFLDEEESKKLFTKYKKGELLSGEVKKMLTEKLIKMINEFQENLKKIDDGTLKKCILTNEMDLRKIIS